MRRKQIYQFGVDYFFPDELKNTGLVGLNRGFSARSGRKRIATDGKFIFVAFLNVGLQRKFLQKRLNVKLNANDIFYSTKWSGRSKFDGLISEGSGYSDSRRGAISISYNFGNENVKSRTRKIGSEDKSNRVAE